MVEEIGFTKLKMYSDHMFNYISNKVKLKTKIPLVKVGDYSYGYDKVNDTELLRINCEHNKNPISFIVSYKQGLLIDVDKNKKEYYNQLNYVSKYLIEYINNNYKHIEVK